MILYYNMVSWIDIKNAISKNEHSIQLKPLHINYSSTVDKFSISSKSVKPVQTIQTVPVIEVVAPTPKVVAKPLAIKNGREIDPISIDLFDTIHLYDNSSYSAKKQFECEEAQRIESLIGELYKSQNGRSRGWTKSGLESLIRPRCASGGDIKELDKSKMAFTWQLVDSDKLYSAFLDYICISKNIRIAVWFEEEKHIIMFPAADKLGVASSSLPLYNVSSKGVVQNAIRDCKQLIQYCDANNVILMPPNSVFHSLSGLTLSELESVGKKLGLSEISGSKKERVAKIVNMKLRQRLEL